MRFSLFGLLMDGENKLALSFFDAVKQRLILGWEAGKNETTLQGSWQLL